ncbi:cell division protein ZipA, partial [Yersinia pestis]
PVEPKAVETPVAAPSTEAEVVEKSVVTAADVQQVEAEQKNSQIETKEEMPEFSLNSNIEKAEISEFNDESSILDAHLHEQKIVDEESALS